MAETDTHLSYSYSISSQLSDLLVPDVREPKGGSSWRRLNHIYSIQDQSNATEEQMYFC